MYIYVYIYICIIYYIMYIYVYIYMYYILYYVYILNLLYTLHIYQQGFSYWKIGGNPPTSQKFAHSPNTWNNFFPHQKIVSTSLNKNFHVIKQ